ncbi:helix-turn-helix domain-containing protein [Variovorax sp.]|uniref:helix-turn-helix domain-containing protein n=1 Tax=Variovorax sp. TaxID=1871043 RepID=UPI003BA8D324
MTREISLLDTTGKPLRMDGRLLLNAGATSWQGFALEVRSMIGDGENPACYNPHPLIALCVRGHVHGVMTQGRRSHRIETRAGGMSIFERGYEVDRASWTGRIEEMVAIEIRPEALRRLMPESDGELHLQTQLSTTDATLQLLASAMRDEIERGCSSGRLHAQGLSMALASYLQARYGCARNVQRPRGRLSQADLRRVYDWVMAHLAEDFGIDALAAELQLSAVHFTRLFRASTGATPYRYVMEQRVRQALALLDGPLALAEIAQAVGFSSQAHFTQVFRQLVGSTPARTRASRVSPKAG